MADRPLIGPGAVYPTPWRLADYRDVSQAIVCADGHHVTSTPDPELAQAIVDLVNDATRATGPDQIPARPGDQAAHGHAVNQPHTTAGDLIICPVDDCEWRHFEPLDVVPQSALAAVFGPGVMTAVAGAQRLQRIEDELERHFATHTPVDYLRTITRLRQLLAQNGVSA